MRRALLSLFLPLMLLLTATPAAAQVSSDGVSAQERYELCLKYYRRSYYTKALETCNRVRNFHRDDPVSVLAELAIADIQFKRADYEAARLTYEDFVRLHPRHEQVDYAVWKIGQCWYKTSPRVPGRDQTSTRQAVNVWTGFNARFPESEYTGEVQQLLGQARQRLAAKELSIARFYRRKGAWRAVRGRAQQALDRYGDTALAPKALAYLGEALHLHGHIAEAQATRERLATEHPGSRWAAHLDRVLEQPAGQEPVDEIFVRPFRIPAAGGGAGAAAGAGAQTQPGM